MPVIPQLDFEWTGINPEDYPWGADGYTTEKGAQFLSSHEPQSLRNNHFSETASIVTAKLAEGALFTFNDGTKPFAANQSMGGFKLIDVAYPTNGADVATKAYADILGGNLNVLQSVRCIATTGSALLGINQGPSEIDGVSILTVGIRVLLNAQADPKENGVYVVQSHDGVHTTLVRAQDFNTSANMLPASFTFIEQGLEHHDQGYVCLNDAPVNPGVDEVYFGPFTGLGSLDAGDGLSKSLQNVLSVNVGNGVEISANALKLTLNPMYSGLSLGPDGLRLATASIASLLVANDSNNLTPVILDGDLFVDVSGTAVLPAQFVRQDKLIFKEAPQGLTDGVNTVFTISDTPKPESVQVFVNGMLQSQGIDEDYQLGGKTITFMSAPEPFSSIRVNYMVHMTGVPAVNVQGEFITDVNGDIMFFN